MLRDIWILSDRHGGLKVAQVILLPYTLTGCKKQNKTKQGEQSGELWDKQDLMSCF